MNRGVAGHPGAEIMAAFFEGKLSPHETAATAAHLRECADCRSIAGEMARFEREEEAVAAPSWAGSWRVRSAAAVAAAVALLFPLARYVQLRTSPMATLVAAAPREHRPTVARVSGYPWARPPAAQRGPAVSPEELELRGAAGKVLRRTANQDTAEARHAAGVAYLLIGDPARSTERLERAAAGSKDARVWNDLAAALYAVGERRSDAYPSALAAARQAIELSPDLAEAHFNRALILEKLKLHEEAAQAWQRYLELDPSSEWSNEARAHLRALPKQSADFDRSFRAAGSDPARVAALVRDFPQETRRHAAGPWLAAWAEAEAAGDASAAAQLAVVRTIGAQLGAASGEWFLHDVVATIDRAGATQRRALVDAHRLYGDGRLAYRARRIEDAESLLRRAEAAFRATGSPMAEAAAYYAACATSDRNRGAEAREALTRLLSRVDAGRHRALAAEIRWQLALIAVIHAEWGAALREGQLAADGFERLGEQENAAFARGFSAHALDRMGATAQAWSEWTRAFAGTGGNSRRRADLLHSAAVVLAATERPREAEAILATVAAITKSHEERALFAAAVLTDHAYLASRRGDGDAAARHLRDARVFLGRIPSEEPRQAVRAQVDVAEAMLQTNVDPHAALAALDRAVEFLSARALHLQLPEAYLQRARAYAAAGDAEAALRDYTAALQEIEQQRRSSGSHAESPFLDTAAQIIDETIELHLRRGESERAFAVADRAHALLATSERATIPPGTALVEYVLLPKRVAIFCVTSRGVTATTVNVERREVAAAVGRFVETIRRKAPEEEIRAQGAQLHRLLVAPLQLTGVEELVLVPDRQLQALPFAALFDGERWLAERYTLRYAPSAARVAPRGGASLSPAVAIGDPAAPGWPALPYSREEASQVASMYGARVVAGSEATRARFIDALQSSALVHYAGHADSDAGAYGALLLAPSDHHSGILDAHEIARLSLHERAPLVVLSACGTFRGDARHVGGMPTLARAFLTAGARAVVGTQWEVDDDLSTPLFVRFHHELRAGRAPARALRTAQIAMLQTSDARLRHPSAWAAAAVLTNLQ